ncbi:O-antigen ligase family protein [uncultured Pseudoteredinibacter sp.]|uniref:O-antigen ligase family protein n=1 Tax=uncultured Pseudoteredinibacter sp. TaxID=1641701 RepID=UPI0026233FFF|nr:O-antigen ligase family protein [uncultured Pseudoteredinibacter sp.]
MSLSKDLKAKIFIVEGDTWLSGVLSGLWLLVLLFSAYTPKVIGVIPFVFGLVGLWIFVKNGESKNVSLLLKGRFRLMGIATILFLLYMGLSSAFTSFPEAALKRTVGLWLIFVLCVISLLLVTRFDISVSRALLRWLPLVVFLGILFNIFESLTGYSLYALNLKDDEAVGAYVINRSLSVLLLLAVPSLLVIRALFEGKKRQIFQAIFLLSLAFLVLQSDSETAKVAVIVVAVSAVLLRLLASLFLYFCGICIVVGMLAAPFVAPLAYQYVAKGIDQNHLFGKDGAHAAQRLEIYDFVARYSMKKPILGHGLDAAREISDFSSQKKFMQESVISHPHNFALQIWLELGAIGVILAAFFILSLLVSLANRKTLSLSYFSVFLIGLCAYSFSYSLWQAWMIAAIVVAIMLLRLIARAYPGSDQSGKY